MQKVSFNNKNSDFFNALKGKVDTYFKSNNIKETGNYKLYIKNCKINLFRLIINNEFQLYRAGLNYDGLG